MSDTLLESICVTGSRPAYKKPAWIIGEVADEVRAQITSRQEQRKTHLRPKSTPSRLNVSFKDKSSRCTRFGQVSSAKCRKYLEEPPLEESSIVLSPGYVLSRSREKINITINTEDFFNEQKEDNRRKKKMKQLDERDVRISQLVKQVDDLTLLLEEERLNHKYNVKKIKEENLKIVDQIQSEHREHIIAIESDHADEIERITKSFEQKILDLQITADAEKARIQSQLETLQGSFEAYKETVATEMDYKWQRREQAMKDECEKKIDEAVSEMRSELMHEKNKEIDAINKEHQRQIQILVEDHAKEVDRLMEKFAECIQDSETLKKTLTEMKAMIQENTELKEKLKTTTDKFKKTQAELENKKVKLAGYEEHFAEKVAEVDNKYSMRMHGLMTDNTDLRHYYMKKCEEVLRLQSKEEREKAQNLREAKGVMQTIIMARARTDVSLAVLRVDPNEDAPYEARTSSPKPIQLRRRKSLPTTQEEMSAAIKQTAAVERPSSPPKPPTLKELGSSQRQRPHTTSMQHAKQTSPQAVPCSARVGGRKSLQLSQVDISEQGIDSLTPRRN